MYKVENILVTTDFSEISAAALEYAQLLSVTMKAKLHLLYVIPEAHLTEKIAGTTIPDESSAKKSMMKFIAEHVDEYTFIDFAIRKGQPAREILHYASEHNIDLVVLATHGRTGIAHMLMGSVAETVVRHSPVPVLTVKPSEMIEPFITRDDIELNLHLDNDSASMTSTQ